MICLLIIFIAVFFGGMKKCFQINKFVTMKKSANFEFLLVISVNSWIGSKRMTYYVCSPSFSMENMIFWRINWIYYFKKQCVETVHANEIFPHLFTVILVLLIKQKRGGMGTLFDFVIFHSQSTLASKILLICNFEPQNTCVKVQDDRIVIFSYILEIAVEQFLIISISIE